jgi:SAM-dependent methyltransferase
MNNENQYWQQLSQDEISKYKHRERVGGMWDEIGHLQFEFIKKRGLLPGHRFLDVGCGCLRGGIHFIQYLNVGNYFGLDINSSLIEAGKLELVSVNCLDKSPNLFVNDKFEFSRFEVKFNFALALSVFTHLFMNHIGRCLIEVEKVLEPQGEFYATFFQAPSSIFLPSINNQTTGITTNYDSDPFHYSFKELQIIAANAGLIAELI